MKTTQLELQNLDNLIAYANPKPVVCPPKYPGRPISRIILSTVPVPQFLQMEFSQLGSTQISENH